MNNKINILIVNPSLFIGGAEVVIKNLCFHLNPEIFNISVFCLKNMGTIGHELFEAGFDVQCIPPSKDEKVDYFTSLKVLKVCKEKNIHLIHSHETHSLVDSCLTKFFLTFEGCSPSVIHTFHCGDYPLPKKRRDLLERFFWRFTDKLVAVGNFQKNLLQTTYHIPDKKIETIWNGISSLNGKIDFDFEKIKQKCKGTIIGTIGTLYEQKGITYLLDTACLLKQRQHEFTFLIAGEGPLHKELEDKTKALGLNDCVQFLGWIQNASTSLLPHVDILFQPSLWEAMSVVILEAMMAGKPIVATNVGENRYVIENEIEGFIIEPADVNNMAASLEKLIYNQELCNRLGKAGREKYERLFSAEIMAKQYERLYTQIFRKKAAHNY